jgi:hypothetical protein
LYFVCPGASRPRSSGCPRVHAVWLENKSNGLTPFPASRPATCPSVPATARYALFYPLSHQATIDAVFERVDAPSRARYCGVPRCPSMAWHKAGFLPAGGNFGRQDCCLQRLVESDADGPISFAVSMKRVYPYLTSLPNGSSPIFAILGGVRFDRSTVAASAASKSRPPSNPVAHSMATTANQPRFIAPTPG